MKRNRELSQSLEFDPTSCYRGALNQQAMEIEMILSTLEGSNMQVEVLTEVIQEQNKLG